MSRKDAQIYSATYSNVPVYEYSVAGNHVMRRRSDDWINATHILKVADYDKPARTRILEREVQKGVHEKVQGGYGKYQGTWIPLPDGRDLAAKNGVLDKLRPIFDFVPGDRSPPPAPKHATATSKPRQPRAQAQSRRQPGKRPGSSKANRPAESRSVYPAQDYDAMNTSVQDVDTPDNETVVSDSQFGDYGDSQFTGLGKRKRPDDGVSQAEKDHQLWADELLDYFMLQDNPMDSLAQAPDPPLGADLNRPIDDKGHTALHWAAAMGDIEVVKDLVRRGASIDVQSKTGETPLMRAVSFTNNFDRLNMDKLAGLLIRTVVMQEWCGDTVFHHIANSTKRKSKYQCARYYMECLLNRMPDVLSPDQIIRVLNTADQNGDTAITIAARNGARKCVRSLIGRGASVDIINSAGETADSLIVLLNSRRQERLGGNQNRQLSSSPFQGDQSLSNIALGGPVQPIANGMNGDTSVDPVLSQGSLNDGASQALEGASDVYRSETALALTSSIMPVLSAKTKTLAMSIDAEVAEKEAELAEAERVISTRRQELEMLKQQAEELRAKEAEQAIDTSQDDDQLVAELEQLLEECEGLTEEEVDATLKDLIAQEEQQQQQQDSPSDDLLMDDDDDSHRLAQLRDLHRLIAQRRDLIRTLVMNLSVAGGGDKHIDYKRLITGALSVREEDVEDMLPEIVQELEEYQYDHSAVA